MGSEEPRYRLTLVTPRQSLTRVSLQHQIELTLPIPSESHTLEQLRTRTTCRIVEPTASRPLFPSPLPQESGVNDLLLGLNPIDVSVVRSRLLIHAQRNQGVLVLDDLLVHFRQVFHTPQDVRYFLSVQGDGWFVPHGVGVWRVKHPDWWR